MTPLDQAAKRGGSFAADRCLWAVLAIALLFRCGASLHFWGPIDTEGADYARIAQNLRGGHGYSGIAASGPQLIFPPLFPYLIYLVSLATGNELVSGRIISMIVGALVVLPVHQIAARLYDQRVGLTAALVVALHPFLIEMSTTLFCEATFLTLILSSLAFALRALERPSFATFAAMGLFFGLAYLVRQESLVIMCVMAMLVGGYVLLTRSVSPMRFGARAGVMALVFAAIAGPYIAWLSVETGGFRIEAKSALNIATEQRILHGVDPRIAEMGIDSALHETGVWNRPHLDVVRERAHQSFPGFSYFGQQLIRVVSAARQALTDEPRFATPLLFALAVVGLFSRPWPLAQLFQQLQLLALLGLSLFALFFIYYIHPRFFVVPVSLLSIWAAAGLLSFGRWCRGTAAFYLQAPKAKLAAQTATILLGALTIASALGANLAALRSASADRALASAGDWLKGHASGPIRVAALDTVVSFHSGATHVWLPQSSGEDALRYLQMRGVNYVMIREDTLADRPYLRDWDAHGPGGDQSRLVYSGDTSGGAFKIYQMDWRQQANPGRSRAG